MAISATSLTSGTDNTSTTSFATASVSPTAGRMVYIGVENLRVGGGGPDAPSGISGAGLTFTQVDTTGNAAADNLSVWRAYAGSPSSGAITISFGTSQAFCSWSVVEVDGAKTTGTNGADSVVQSATNENLSASSLTATLSAFADAGNGALAFHTWAAGGASVATATPDTGWTEIDDTGNTDAGPVSYAMQSQWRADNDTSAAVTWSAAGALHSIAIEIAAAAATLTQARSQWRNDDGSETTATWAAAEDADISVAALTAKRLRVQVAATGDPSAKSFKLQYRKVGDGTWRDIN